MSSPDPIAAVVEVFAQERCSAILRTTHASAVAPAMQAAVDGGLRIVEFTLTTPGALEQIAAFARQRGVLVGAGTVLDVGAADRAVDAGARFLVSPVADPEVIGWARERGIVAIPGVATPTEMLLAHRAGAPILKLFPAPAGGPDFVRAVLAPMPFLRIFPTNGVDASNVGAYLAAGAFGVGFVAALFPPADLAAGRFDAIRERARALRAAVRSAM
jgi:Entner-Doudoroff aldolase